MAHIDVPLLQSGFGQTRRADNWWAQPVVVFLILSAFIVYATWAALQGHHYRFGPYLSPFYSAELLHLQLSLPSSYCWWFSRPTGRCSGPKESLRLRELPQPSTHGLCLVQSFQRGVCRSLCSDVFDGRVDRLEDPLMAEYITHE